jgi:peptidoglycan hydrolase-like protein with peptidoglycan-binding domain
MKSASFLVLALFSWGALLSTPATADVKKPTKLEAAQMLKVVASIQKTLNKLGGKLKVDGVMGKSTRKAIAAYQKENGLKVTGEPNQETLKHLGL